MYIVCFELFWLPSLPFGCPSCFWKGRPTIVQFSASNRSAGLYCAFISLPRIVQLCSVKMKRTSMCAQSIRPLRWVCGCMRLFDDVWCCMMMTLDGVRWCVMMCDDVRRFPEIRVGIAASADWMSRACQEARGAGAPKTWTRTARGGIASPQSNAWNDEQPESRKDSKSMVCVYHNIVYICIIYIEMHAHTQNRHKTHTHKTYTHTRNNRQTRS